MPCYFAREKATVIATQARNDRNLFCYDWVPVPLTKSNRTYMHCCDYRIAEDDEREGYAIIYDKTQQNLEVQSYCYEEYVGQQLCIQEVL